jgi:hypothetical protein
VPGQNKKDWVLLMLGFSIKLPLEYVMSAKYIPPLG